MKYIIIVVIVLFLVYYYVENYYVENYYKKKVPSIRGGTHSTSFWGSWPEWHYPQVAGQKCLCKDNVVGEFNYSGTCNC